MGLGIFNSRVDLSIKKMVKKVEISDFKYSQEYEKFKKRLNKEIKKAMKMEHTDSFAKLETLIHKINSNCKKADIELKNMKKTKENEMKIVSVDNKENLEYLKERLDCFKQALDQKQRRMDWYLKGMKGYEKNKDNEGSDAL